MSHTTNCGCTETQETTHICGCAPSTPCDCPILDLSTDCSLYDGENIQCQSTNVVLKNTVLSVALKNIVDYICQVKAEIANRFRIVNIGTGAKIYKTENLLGQKELRTITSTNSSVTITENATTIDLSVPGITIVPTASNIGTGAEVFKELSTNDYKFRKIKTENSGTGVEILKSQLQNTSDISIIARKLLSSDGTVTITQNANDVDITIPAPPTLGLLRTFYVNSAYGTPVDSDGSVIRPYVTYDEAKTAFIGTGTITTPEFIGSVIIIQTDSTTAINPTVNRLKLKFENNSTLIYTGTDAYMFDTEVLYPLIPKGVVRNNLTIGIAMELLGEGSTIRTAGIGLVRGIGSNRNGLGEAGDEDSIIVLNGDITLKERTQYPNEVWTGDITNTLGETLESSYGTPHKYSTTLLPTTPLLYAEYESVLPFRWGVITKGNIKFETLVNTAIKAKGIKLVGDNLNFLVKGDYIATTSGTKMVGFPTYYTPQPTRNMIELDNSGIFLTGDLKVDDIGGYSTTGVTNFIKIINNGNIESGNIDIFSNYYMDTFLNVSDVSNTANIFNLSNSFEGSKIKSVGNYFLNTSSPTYILKLINGSVAGFVNKSVGATDITINTDKTFSSFLEDTVLTYPGATQFTIDELGKVSGANATTANQFVTKQQLDAAVISGSGATNLTTLQTATNFTINSDTGTDAVVPLGNGTNAGASSNDYTTAEKSKLSGIASGATVNSSDATLLARANHTGTQLSSTISDFETTTNALIQASEVNTAFTTKTYLATMSVAHNTSSPNFKIDVTGNLSLTITGTVNGDSGIVNLYFTAAQVATLNGFANLVITGSGAMIPVYFIHDNDGIKWYKDEVGGAAVDTSLFALQDGTILYHTVKTFVTTATISTVGTAVTISTSQFQSFASVGLKLTINGESRIITAFTDGFNVTVNSAYSTNYVSQPSSAWGIYSAFLRYRPSDSAVFIKNSSGFDTASFYNNNVVAVSNAIESLNNSYQLSNEGLKLRSDGFIRTSSTSNANGTSDIGLRRNSAGVYEIYNGVTNTGLDADRRDLLVRNLVSKSNIYANDAAADADTALPSGAFYKITGSRAVYQKS